jgi:hypothetical protein
MTMTIRQDPVQTSQSFGQWWGAVRSGGWQIRSEAGLLITFQAGWYLSWLAGTEHDARGPGTPDEDERRMSGDRRRHSYALAA